MKIYDCFLFFNELDILEIRLNELYNVVDKFIIVEATESHNNKPKDLFFLKNKSRFNKFLDKIDHFIIDRFDSNQCWARENYQRNFLQNGVSKAEDNDIILISDLDEIPKKEQVLNLKSQSLFPYVFVQRHSSVFLNRVNKYEQEGRWLGTAAALKKDIITFQDIINTKNNFTQIENGGWHFSYCGDAKKIAYKIKNFAHSEYENEANDLDILNYRIDNNLDLLGRNGGETKKIEIDNTFPSYLVNNIEKYEHLIES